MHHIDHEQLMLCISNGYTSLHRDRYSIYPIDIDIYNIDINVASTAGPPQGHRGGEAGYTTHPPATQKQTIPQTRATPQPSTTGPQGGGIPTIHHAWGGGLRRCTIYIYIISLKASFTSLLISSGTLRQLYLGVLWLYTRESWLPHVIGALAGKEQGPKLRLSFRRCHAQLGRSRRGRLWFQEALQSTCGTPLCTDSKCFYDLSHSKLRRRPRPPHSKQLTSRSKR